MGYLLFSFMTESDALAFLGNPFLHLVTLVAKFNLSLHPELDYSLSAVFQGRRASSLWLYLSLLLACSNNLGGQS